MNRELKGTPIKHLLPKESPIPNRQLSKKEEEKIIAVYKNGGRIIFNSQEQRNAILGQVFGNGKRKIRS